MRRHFIVNRVSRQGYAPTMREIGAQFGIRSTNGVAAHLAALVKKGLIRRDPMISRGTVVLTPTPSGVPTPPATPAPTGDMVDVCVVEHPGTTREHVVTVMRVDDRMLDRARS